MGQDNLGDGEREPVDARLLRTSDLIDLRLEAPGCTIEAAGDGAELVAGPDAALVVHFPPQHLGERVWQVMPEPTPVPDAPSDHRIAGPSRLVFELPEGTRIPYTLEGVLGALPDLSLLVAPNATPAGASVQGAPRPPGERETAIEAPYHLVVSPSAKNAFTHARTPVGPPGRHELWRTRLTVRGADGELDDTNTDQRIVRALWNRDADVPPPPFTQPLTTFDRKAIVEQTSGGDPLNADTPLMVANLQLSSLGAWFDWKQSWDFGATIADYRHQSFMGRDGYVRVVYPGFLFPFGHRCYLVKLTEREIKHREHPAAYLWQRFFIIIRQPTRTYPESDRDNPFAQVTISPLVTPDIDPPAEQQHPFVPTRNGVPFPFILTTIDRGGETRAWPAPLVFVQAGRIRNRFNTVYFPEEASPRYHPVRQILGRGQQLAVARPVKAGDSSIEVGHLIFDGQIDAPNITSRPYLTEARAVVPSMRHLSPQAPAVDLVFAQPYLLHGLPDRALDAPTDPAKPNSGELILALKSAPPAIDFTSGSDRSGGFVAPNLSVRGISRALGAIGESGAAPSAFDAGTFDAASFLAGAMPKLFGLFNLLEILAEEVGLDKAPSFVSDALEPITKLLTEAERLKSALADAQARLAAEVADAAHGGAAAVAQHALDELDARVGQVTTHADALLAALAGLPGSADAVSAAAVQLAGDLQPLLDTLGLPGVPAAVRSALSKPVEILKTLTELASTAKGLADLLEGIAGGQVTARLQWRPTIGSWGLPGVPEIFKPPTDGLHIDVEVRASASAPPSVDIVAELVDFSLNLIGTGSGALMQLRFRRVGFHAGSTGKPEVDVVFGGVGFLGPLAFVDRLRELIPFDGFSDPPYVDVAPEGVTAGFDLALPNVGIGVFSLENISLGADARVPFLGDAMTVGFHFCSKDSPFRLTVMCIGGGGWLSLRAAPKGLVLLELGLEACASLSIDLGVASGSVSIAVGVYLRLEADKGLLTAYFRIRGEVDVLGLISASITLELSLSYQFETGKLVGRASLTIDVEVLFFSASVEIVVERQLAGSKGDPTMYQIMPPDASDLNDDWAAYCDAFAPLPA
ncbi:MAG: hypothetical protein LCH96_16780 [Actinobacteria bacterium]|nr:hypothetical protein [Actinomycetota bacterium]